MMMRMDEAEILGKTQLFEVSGCQPPERPKKTWKKNMHKKLA